MKTDELEKQITEQPEEIIVTFDGKNNGKFFNKKNIKYFIYVNIGILLTAMGIHFFKTPNGFATGGVSGLSVILVNLLPFKISQGIYMLVINVLLLIIGFIFLGKGCGVLTCYCSLMISLENLLFEKLFPVTNEAIFQFNDKLTGEPLLELVYAVLLTGIGSAILFKYKASSGGTDIVALIFKKHTDLNVGTALLFTDLFIALATFVGKDGGSLFFDAETGLFSLLGLFAKIFIIDDIIDSINLCKSFTIITTKPDEINNFIMNKLAHSATIYHAEGAYTHEGRTVVMTVCRKSEAIRLRREVNKIDPGAFMIITKTSEIMGRGFRDNVN
jgi:uncharacterized membrane-anchored protein YitT (DUF2179 family)